MDTEELWKAVEVMLNSGKSQPPEEIQELLRFHISGIARILFETGNVMTHMKKEQDGDTIILTMRKI